MKIKNIFNSLRFFQMLGGIIGISSFFLLYYNNVFAGLPNGSVPVLIGIFSYFGSFVCGTLHRYL